MLFNCVLLSALLLVPAVLAAPGPGARIDQRRSGLNKPADWTGASAPGEEYSANWAGPVWAMPKRTFTSVTGTFTVPTPKGANGNSASIWVGIDGQSCQTSILQTGITLTVVKGGSPQYGAWYEWYPAPSVGFSESVDISAGDVIRLTVTATSPTSGIATIENLTNKKSVSTNMNSTYPLCGQNAEWIVEDYNVNGGLVPFANFTTVDFKDAVATGHNRTYHPFGATLWNIVQNNKVITNVTTNAHNPSTARIKYV